MDPKLGQVDADFPVVLGALVCLQVMLEGLGIVGGLGTIGSVKIIGRAVIEGERRGANLGAHVANGGHSGSRGRFDTRTLVFDDGPSSAVDGENTSELGNDARGELVNNELTGVKSEECTVGSSPSTDLSGKLDADDPRTLKLPRTTNHDIDSIGATTTTSNHAQATGVWRVRIYSDHQPAGECVILENDLKNNTRAGFSESRIVLLE